MGRKPNPIILEYFERGAKLTDNSNRYQHRCKACGEDFPKGRLDSLINHLTRKCPAISEGQRANACLTLHGISNVSSHQNPTYDGLPQTGHHPHPHPHAGPVSVPVYSPITGPVPGPSVEHSQNQIWTPLETLAEVSRQIEAHEKHDDHIPTSQDATTGITPITSNTFESLEQLAFEHPSINTDPRLQHDIQDAPDRSCNMSSTEDRLRRALINVLSHSPQSNVSVAAAATARLDPSLLEPHHSPDQVVHEQPTHAQSTDMLIEYPSSSPERQRAPGTTKTNRKANAKTPRTRTPKSNANSDPDLNRNLKMDVLASINVDPNEDSNMNANLKPNANDNATWDAIAYISEVAPAPATVSKHAQRLAPTLNRGGFRMDTINTLHGPRHRHSRARFDSSRRKEVQEIRRIGACIRCRILRKTCSKGTPCAACKKVLSPRIWLTGCVRTKLSEQINLYSAGVQVVMAQKRINGYKETHHLENTGVILEASHFPETGHKAVFQVLQGVPKDVDNDLHGPGPVVLLDNNTEDIPGKVEAYMRESLSELIRREPSHYIRVTLDAAVMVANETDDELLKRSLELWGIVEMMDRERQWIMFAKYPGSHIYDYWIKDDGDCEAYSNVCMQLTAAAERKASAASKVLLNGIQKNLQDGKSKLGFPMFLTVMLFLNCMEKTTWAFKAWDEENLRPKWPLEKPPSNFTNQGQELTELLRMLLVIRHILPKTVASSHESPLVADDNDPTIQNYFQNLNVTPAYLEARRDPNNFQPTDSRSLEFLFCAPLLLN